MSHHARRAVLLAVLALPIGCESDPSEPPVAPVAQADKPLDPQVPESWVRPERSACYWTVWADVFDFVGEKRWAALDTSWMAERARTDMAALTPEDDYADEYLLSGLWRLGLLRKEVIQAFMAREDVVWPLDRVERQLRNAWRPRLERWLRAQPEGKAKENLATKLDVTWREAVAKSDVNRAARVVEARETWIGKSTADGLKTAAEKLIRDYIAEYKRGVDKDWRNGRFAPGAIALMERFGVPDGIDLGPIVAAAKKYNHEMQDAVIPLPHPQALHISTLRLERLARRATRQ